MTDYASRSDVCPDVAGLPVQVEAKNVRKTGSSRGDGHFSQPLFLKPLGSPGYLPMPLACRAEQWRDPSPVSPGHGSPTLQQQLTDLQLASSSSGRQGYREEETVSMRATWRKPKATDSLTRPPTLRGRGPRTLPPLDLGGLRDTFDQQNTAEMMLHQRVGPGPEGSFRFLGTRLGTRCYAVRKPKQP